MSQKEKILNLFYDKEWTNAEELHEICWRYGARIFDLKKQGFKFEKRKGVNGLEEWKLIDEPQLSTTPQIYKQTQQILKLV
jgi:hypothetical protein